MCFGTGNWTENLSTPGPARYTIMYALSFFNVHTSIPLFKYFPVADGDVKCLYCLLEVEYKGKQSNVILTTQGESTLKIFGE
jgi:hypothetical protein